MIQKDGIPDLVTHLKSRQVKLYHACQLVDFLTYLKLGGIPSRELLVKSKNEYTAFDTDDVDKVNGVWDKVFLNLSDFGWAFSSGGGATPTTFGPFLLKFDPIALRGADDIAITLRSAGSSDYNRELESLSSIDEVNQLFAYPVENGSPSSTYIKYKESLRADFKFEKATNPEVNISISNGILPFTYLTGIIVDPYSFFGINLIELIKGSFRSKSIKISPQIRQCRCKERIQLYQEIADLIFSEIPSFEELLSMEKGTDDLKRWVQQLQGFNLEWQFQRYAKYLREGTIYPAASMINC